MKDFAHVAISFFRELAARLGETVVSSEFGQIDDTIIGETWLFTVLNPKNAKAARIRADVREVQLVLAIGDNGCRFEWDIVSDADAGSVLSGTRRACLAVITGRYVEVVTTGLFGKRRFEARVEMGEEVLTFSNGFPLIPGFTGHRIVNRYEPYSQNLTGLEG